MFWPYPRCGTRTRPWSFRKRTRWAFRSWPRIQARYRKKVGRGGILVPRGDVTAWRDALLTWPAGRTFAPEAVLSVEEHLSRLEPLYQEAMA